MKTFNAFLKLVRPVWNAMQVATIILLCIQMGFRAIGDDRAHEDWYNIANLLNPYPSLDELVIEVVKLINDDPDCFTYDRFGVPRPVSCFGKNEIATGLPVYSLNDTIALEIAIGKRIEYIIPDTSTVFFNPKGIPLIYYYQNESGKLELFSYSGRHPQLNQKLLPITSKLALEIHNAVLENNYEMFVSPQKNAQRNESAHSLSKQQTALKSVTF